MPERREVYFLTHRWPDLLFWDGWKKEQYGRGGVRKKPLFTSRRQEENARLRQELSSSSFPAYHVVPLTSEASIPLATLKPPSRCIQKCAK